MNLLEFNLLELMKLDPRLVVYDSRVNLILELEHSTKLLFTEYYGGNRKNNLIVGIPSIGKTYLIKKIAATLGENLENLVVVYLNVSQSNFSISILEAIVDAVMLRKLPFLFENATANLMNIVETITQNGKRLVLFVDDAQDLYPSMGQETFDDVDQRKVNILIEIYRICSYSDVLTFVIGKSMRLSNLAYKRINFQFMGRYPRLNDSRLSCVHLYPILREEEFQRYLVTLKLSGDEEKMYKKCGGCIGVLLSGKSIPTLTDFVNDEFFFVAHQILHFNTLDREKVDVFNREYIPPGILDEMLKETFDSSRSYLNLIDQWCDDGFLFKYENGISFLSTDLFDFVEKRQNQLSLSTHPPLKYLIQDSLKIK